jgi:hypothetical protein
LTESISYIVRVVEADGKEYVRIPVGQSVLPWDEQTRKGLSRLFDDKTVFSLKSEARCRRYDGPKDWWLTMTAEEFIKSCIYGRDMR